MNSIFKPKIGCTQSRQQGTANYSPKNARNENGNFNRPRFYRTTSLVARTRKTKDTAARNVSKTTVVLEADSQYLTGNFSSGRVKVKVTEITEEPGAILGEIEGSDPVLDFLAYGITFEELDKIVIGNDYLLHWMESICYLEPFEQGYQRRFLTYKVEAN